MKLFSKHTKQRYSAEFERFWLACIDAYRRTGSKRGLKPAAYKRFCDVGPSPATVDQWIAELANQAEYKLAIRDTPGRDDFSPSFKHVERWLSYGCYDNFEGTGNRAPRRMTESQADVMRANVTALVGGMGI